MDIKINKDGELYNSCTEIAKKARVLQTAAADTFGETISLDTAILCAVLSETKKSINDQLKHISEGIYDCC
ncbi:MAG: hypothetical protein IIT39_02445 [Clostridia bacterium]|nr:hypothetical protein [Clostridia bacterium]